MVRKVFSNTAVATRLDGGLATGVYSFTVEDGSTYPSANFVIEADVEAMLVGTRTGNTFSSVTRGYDNTTETSHEDLAVVRHVVLAEDLDSRLMALPAQVPTTGDGGKVYVYDETNDEFDLASQSGGGDMYSSMYDPTTVQEDAFDLGHAHGNLDGGIFT